MVAHVKADRFIVGGCTQRNDDPDDLQQNEADDAAVDNRDPHGRRLNTELAGLPKSAPSAMPFSAFCANTPVSSAPTVPPTPCAATTSSESSSEVFARQTSRGSWNRGNGAERDGAHRADEARGRGNRDQSDDDRGRRADGGRLAGTRVVEQRPDDERSHRREEGGHERQPGDGACRQSAARVETEPAEPEQTGAQQRERHVVRQQRRAWIVAAFADDNRRDQRRDTGVDVHDRASGEVERTHVGEPAAAPDPVRNRA